MTTYNITFTDTELNNIATLAFHEWKINGDHKYSTLLTFVEMVFDGFILERGEELFDLMSVAQYRQYVNAMYYVAEGMI